MAINQIYSLESEGGKPVAALRKLGSLVSKPADEVLQLGYVLRSLAGTTFKPACSS
jgi:hypothetical protein